ncbi:MAG TPA: DUF742 domain-containing protein [Trebonia sp.]
MSSFDEYPHVRPVRPYVVTGGRARPTRNTIRPEMLLIAAPGGKELPVTASSEERALLRMCHQLLSLVEVAAHMRLPVSVTGVVASDLVDAGFLTMRLTDEPPSDADRPLAGSPRPTRPSRDLLQEVLNGLDKLT